MGQSKTITRAELYSILWNEPTSRVSKSYGISDVGLAKICRKHDIPRPPRGYWAQRQHGQKPKQTPLPNPNHNPTIEINEGPPRMDHPNDTTAGTDIGPIEIRVNDTLRGCHELVSRANEELQSAKINADGIITATEERTLNICTSKACMRRALLIIDALLKESQRHEYPVSAGPTITILGHSIKLGIHEIVDEKREPDEEIDLNKPYEFGHSRHKTSRTPSGRLVLSITEGRGYWATGGRCTWRDTDKQRLEDQLDKVLFGLIKTAEMAQRHEEKQKQQAELARQEAARREEEQRQRAERRKQYKAEKARFDELLKQAKDLHRSRQVRELIEAVRTAHTAKGPIAPDSEIAQWIEWATQQADRLDPLRPSPPSILDEHFEEDERPSATAWGSIGRSDVPKTYWEQRNWWNRSR
jgi:hypothetical protein